MKKYTYNGKSNLTFSFEDKDYLVYGEGPHELPEDSPVVQSNTLLGRLALQNEVDIKVVKAEAQPKA